MLAAVFYMQPVGQLVANVLAIITTSLSHDYIYKDSDPSNCTGDCMETTDKIWRWIVGLGAVIPAITLVARFLIPESPRYLLEVEKDSHTAAQNSLKYFTNYADPFRKPGQVSVPPDPFRSNTQPTGINDRDTSPHQGMPVSVDKPSRIPDGNLEYQQPVAIAKDHAVSQLTGDPDRIEQYPDPFSHYLRPQGPATGEMTLNASSKISSPESDAGKNDPDGIHSVVPSNSSTNHSIHTEKYDDKEEQSKTPHMQKDDPLTMANNNASGTRDNLKTRKASVSIASSLSLTPPFELRLHPVSYSCTVFWS
jgi:Sugar (and other) transporter